MSAFSENRIEFNLKRQPDWPSSLFTVRFWHFKVGWIAQESPIYRRVEGSLLYQYCPLSVNKANFSSSRYTT